MFLTFKLAWRNVLRNRERSLLTLIGVLLAIGSYVALVSLAEGLGRRVEDEFNARDVHLYIICGRDPGLPVGTLGAGGTSGEMVTAQTIADLKKIEGVRRIEGVCRESWAGQHSIIPVLAMDPAAFPVFFPQLRGCVDLKERQILWGRGIALAEFPKGLPTTYRRGADEYAVAGEVAGLGFQDYTALIPVTAKLSERGFQEAWIQLADQTGTEATRNAVMKSLPKGVRVLTADEYLASSRAYVHYARLLQIAIASIGVLISITAAMNTTLMSTYERLKEFAILRAIGASRLQVALIIAWESILLSWIGGTLGLFFGLLASDVLDKAIGVLLELPFPLARITAPLAAQALLLSGFIGLVGSVLPSIVTARMKLVEGLRGD